MDWTIGIAIVFVLGAAFVLALVFVVLRLLKMRRGAEPPTGSYDAQWSSASWVGGTDVRCPSCAHRVAMDDTRCPYCGLEFDPEALLCSRCGAAVDPNTPQCPYCLEILVQSEAFFCPLCEARVLPDSRRCPRCGGRFWSPLHAPDHARDEGLRRGPARIDPDRVVVHL